MSYKEKNAKKFQIKILDKEYPIESNLSEERLANISVYLDSKFAELQKSAPMVPIGRLAILASLNIANELYDLKQKYKVKCEHYESQLDRIIAALQNVL